MKKYFQIGILILAVLGCGLLLFKELSKKAHVNEESLSFPSPQTEITPHTLHVEDFLETPIPEAQDEIPAVTEPPIDLSMLAAENERGQSVFDVSAAEWIESFNSVYRQYHGEDYLTKTDSEEWGCSSELSPRFGYEATRYKFSENKKAWSMPTVSVYSPDEDEIYEVRITFDDHGYRENYYIKYKGLCSCLLKMVCPELSEEETDEVFRQLYALAYDNFFGDHHWYGDPERPPLTVLLQRENVGFYCFYGSGNIELCMIPLTPTALELLEAEGTEIQTI